jgi:hypothetical protein
VYSSLMTWMGTSDRLATTLRRLHRTGSGDDRAVVDARLGGKVSGARSGVQNVKIAETLTISMVRARRGDRSAAAAAVLHRADS